MEGITKIQDGGSNQCILLLFLHSDFISSWETNAIASKSTYSSLCNMLAQSTVSLRVSSLTCKQSIYMLLTFTKFINC